MAYNFSSNDSIDTNDTIYIPPRRTTPGTLYLRSSVMPHGAFSGDERLNLVNIISVRDGYIYIGEYNTQVRIKGEKGDQGEKGDAFTYEDFTEEQLVALTGPTGPVGPKGRDGDSFYNTYLAYAREQGLSPVLTEIELVAYLLAGGDGALDPVELYEYAVNTQGYTGTMSEYYNNITEIDRYVTVLSNNQEN